MTTPFLTGCCGSASVVMPVELRDEAVVCCSRCGRSISTWREFKERAQALIRGEDGADRRPPPGNAGSAAASRLHLELDQGAAPAFDPYFAPSLRAHARSEGRLHSPFRIYDRPDSGY